MYNKKYVLEKIIEFNEHNPIYDGMQGCVCYLAYLKVGQRGWFLCEQENWFDSPHRICTSVIQKVKYAYRNRIIVTTQNTKFTFVAVKDC